MGQVECLPMVRETLVQSQVMSHQRLLKWYLIPPCLTLSVIRYGLRVKWSNQGKEVAPSPHLGVVAIEKVALWSHSTTITNFPLLIWFQVTTTILIILFRKQL